MVCQIIWYLQQCFLILTDNTYHGINVKKVAADFLKVIEQHGPTVEEMLNEWKVALHLQQHWHPTKEELETSLLSAWQES